MEEGILHIYPCTYGALLEPLSDRFKIFHTEIYVKNIYIELFRFRIGPAHLTDGSFLEKLDHFSIKNIRGFSIDGGVVSCNLLPRGTFDPGGLIASLDDINAILTSTNLPITVLTVSQSATQLQ